MPLFGGGTEEIMLDVMIIDDDSSLREYLKRITEWERLGLRLVCEAGDSETARELYLLYRPKIIVADINIPIISGLELAREFAVMDPEIRFIVITAYNDFDYVRDSVELGAVKLLPKPLKVSDVNEAFEKAVSYFEEMRLSRTSAEALKQLLEDNMPALREKYVASLFKSLVEQQSHEEIAERLRPLDLDLPGPYFAVVRVVIEQQHLVNDEKDALLSALLDTVSKSLEADGFKAYLFFDGHFRINCVVSFDKNDGCELLEEVMNNVYEQMMFLFRRRIFAGIGEYTKDLSDLYISADQALTALNYQNVIGSETVINYRNIEILDSPKQSGDRTLAEKVRRMFRQDRLQEFEAFINQQFEAAIRGPEPLAQTRELALLLTNTVITESISQGLSFETIQNFFGIFNDIAAADNISSLRDSLIDFIKQMQEIVSKKRSSSKHRLILMAKEFISENLGNEKLNLDMVSDHVGLSSIYFCSLFHKVEGVSFNEYLNITRIERAKELLRTTNKKVFEISGEIGYTHPRYFSYVFKRLAGVSPMEFKESE